MTFFRPDQALNQTVQTILEATFQEFPSLKRDQIALTWIVYD